MAGFLHNFNSKLDPTTDTLLKAIAALAIQGANIRPIMLNAPAARGIPENDTCQKVQYQDTREKCRVISENNKLPTFVICQKHT